MCSALTFEETNLKLTTQVKMDSRVVIKFCAAITDGSRVRTKLESSFIVLLAVRPGDFEHLIQGMRGPIYTGTAAYREGRYNFFFRQG